MIVKNIENKDNDIFKFIESKLNSKNKTIHMVLSQVDDQAFEKIDSILESKVDSLYICVNRNLTTEVLFREILQSEKYINKYVYNNSVLENIKLNNLIMLVDEKDIEVILIPFSINVSNLVNSTSFAMYFSGNLEQDDVLNEMYNSYLGDYSYLKLTEEFINKCKDEKAFRNVKANNIYKDINVDEMIQSFRTVGASENPDEILRVIQSQKEAKKLSLDKSEVSFNIDDGQVVDTNVDINSDFDIDIDIG